MLAPNKSLVRDLCMFLSNQLSIDCATTHTDANLYRGTTLEAKYSEMLTF